MPRRPTRYGKSCLKKTAGRFRDDHPVVLFRRTKSRYAADKAVEDLARVIDDTGILTEQQRLGEAAAIIGKDIVHQPPKTLTSLRQVARWSVMGSKSRVYLFGSSIKSVKKFNFGFWLFRGKKLCVQHTPHRKQLPLRSRDWIDSMRLVTSGVLKDRSERRRDEMANCSYLQ